MIGTAGISIILRLELDNSPGGFLRIARAIEDGGGDIVGVDVIASSHESSTRDITIHAVDALAGQVIVEALGKIDGVRVVNVSDRTFLLHLGGKIQVQVKAPVKNRDDLSRVYTPDVARVCLAIQEDPQKAFQLTIKRNTVAIVTDGTAVLGLGNIGPKAAMPVMEGKAMLFKQFANVDAFPICLDTTDTDEIVRTVKALSPVFGGINLEDISAPRCFEIEKRLQEELDIPVFHDDQHGTAVVLLASLINALKVVGKNIEDVKVVVTGIGAAGVACSDILLSAGAKNVICVDRHGTIVRTKTYDNEVWNDYASRTNPYEIDGDLMAAIEGADVFIGLSGPGVLKVEHLRKMAKDPIVFAMANPTPEIDPAEAEPYVRILATGRSDYPNQINNVLCFPGMFRGVFDCRARLINEEMKLAAARAIAAIVSDEELNEHYIVPSVFNQKVTKAVSQAVVEAAVATGVARRERVETRYS